MKKGFTLTELLAVIVIVAILSVAAVGGYKAMGNSSKRKALEQKIAQIELAADKYAYETNINKNTTVSVNKLVVMGYLQPDSTNADGLASIMNPVTNENMICNLVEITITKDTVKTKYNDTVRDCDISDKDSKDGNITITAYTITGNTTDIFGYEEEDVLPWTNKDILLYVESSYFSNAYSVIYDYGGNNIEKSTTKKLATSVTAPDVVDEYYNEIIINNIGSIFNNTLNVIVIMKDGSTKIQSIKIKIDKEPPVGYVVNNNNMSTNNNSEREVELYLDDGTGSGVKGFYVNTDNSIDEEKYIPKDGSRITGTFDSDSNKGTFMAKKGTYYIYVKDNVGNISPAPIKADVTNFDPKDLSCVVTVQNLNDINGTPLTIYRDGWFNKPVTIKYSSTAVAGDGGFKWNFIKGREISDESDLKQLAETGKYAATHINEENEMNLTTFGGGIKGISTRNDSIKKCKETVGLDFTSPTISFSYSGNQTIKKQHTVGIEITDDRSGFYPNEGTSRKIQYNWSTSSSSPGSSWNNINLSLSADGKKMTGQITGSNLTGTYYLHLKAGDITDKAQNRLNVLSPGVGFKFDNTAPRCSVTKTLTDSESGVNVRISCSDNGSVQSGCASSNPTSDSGLKSGKSYTVSDKVGNSSSCSVSVTSYVERRRKTAKNCTKSCCGTYTTCGSYSTVCNSIGTGCPKSNSSRTCKAGSNHYTASGDFFCCASCCPKTTHNNNCTSGSCCGWNSWGSWSTSNSACDSDTCKSESRTKYK